MLGSKESPQRFENGTGRVMIHGTKTMEGRGWCYDYVVILGHEIISVGSEEGNYAGGTWLSLNTDGYQERRRPWFLKCHV